VIEGLPRSRRRRQEVLMEVEPLIEELRAKGINVDLSLVIKTPEEAVKGSPLYLDMVEDAVVLYDRGLLLQGA